MLKKDIKDLISYHLRWYGRGYKYDCELNGTYIPSITELKNQASEGDEVKISVSKGHQRHYYGGYEIDRIRFTIEQTDKTERQIQEYRDRHKGSSIYACPRDYQKQKLYRWERNEVDGFKSDKVEDLGEANKYVKKIFNRYGMNPASVKYHAGRTRTCSYFGGGFQQLHEIRIGDWGFSKAVLIHESAHGFVYEMGYKGFVSSHGPLFVAVYIELLSEFLGYDKQDLIESAKERGLKVIEDLDIEKWYQRGNRDEDITISDLNYLRIENYALRDGTRLTESQVETLNHVRNGKTEKVDGRSARALVRRGILLKRGDDYKLSKKGENIVI